MFLKFLSEAAAAHGNALPVPSYVFGIIAMVVFIAAALVTFFFRDVANRHAEKAEVYSTENKNKH